MAQLNLKDFLRNGAFIQTGSDMFHLFLGPFNLVKNFSELSPKSNSLLFKTNFWSFIENSENFAQNSIYEAANSAILNREEFIRLLSLEKSLKPEIDWLAVNTEDFKKQFDWSQEQFLLGTLKKTVPIIYQDGHGYFESAQKIYILTELLQQKNYGWSYGHFDHDRAQIGHTPEILLKWGENTVQTVALAGTYACVDQAEIKILNDAKILNEHQLVVDDIKHKLSQQSPRIEPTTVLTLKHLLHLKTEFSFECKSQSELIQRITQLHPTAAMGLYPFNKEKYKEWSGFYTQNLRGDFASPFGFLSTHNAHIVVAIRNILIDSKSIRIISGCGVTTDSIYEDELSESENKRYSVKKMMGLI